MKFKNMLRHLGHSQQTILQSLLTAGGPMTIDKLGENLGISKNAVYQHVGALERTGLVEKSRLNRTGGRPSQSYILSPTGQNLFPKHYALISSLLVDLIKEELGTDRLNECLERIGEKLSEDHLGKVRGKTLEERVPIVVDIMRDLGYQTVDGNADPCDAENAILKDNELGFRAHNCVFHDLVNDHNEICTLDIAMISKLLDAKVDHAACMAKGDPCCKFKVDAINSKSASNGKS
jgi:predicted ArsR family transcriptional regulator